MPDRLVKSLDGDWTAVGESDALAAAQIVHARRDDDAARLSTGAEPRGLLHRGAEEVVLLGHRFPCGHADAHMQRMLLSAIALVEVTLNLHCSAECLVGGDERSHDPVA